MLEKMDIQKVSIAPDDTRVIVEYTIDVIGIGKHEAVANIVISGSDKNLLKNQWILRRVFVPKKRQMKDYQTVLVENTKKLIWEFVLKNPDKVERMRDMR
jgi:hypothetical protein